MWLKQFAAATLSTDTQWMNPLLVFFLNKDEKSFGGLKFFSLFLLFFASHLLMPRVCIVLCCGTSHNKRVTQRAYEACQTWNYEEKESCVYLWRGMKRKQLSKKYIKSSCGSLLSTDIDEPFFLNAHGNSRASDTVIQIIFHDPVTFSSTSFHLVKDAHFYFYFEEEEKTTVSKNCKTSSCSDVPSVWRAAG